MVYNWQNSTETEIMTTIVYDYKTHSIGYDSRICRGDVILSDSFEKWLMKDGIHFFYAGSVADFDEFMRADKTFGNKCPTAVGVSVLMVRDNVVYECGFDEDDGYWEVECKYNIAIGSGSQFALAALACGKSALEAVKIAATFDPYTGGEIYEHKIGAPKIGRVYA